MNTEELTGIANVHQSILTRHDQEIAGVRTLLNLTASQRRDDMNAINQILSRVAQQQEANAQAIANLTAEQQLSRQDINSLTAGILDLRNPLTYEI
jgi:hypothetical protein